MRLGFPIHFETNNKPDDFLREIFAENDIDAVFITELCPKRFGTKLNNECYSVRFVISFWMTVAPDIDEEDASRRNETFMTPRILPPRRSFRSCSWEVQLARRVPK